MVKGRNRNLINILERQERLSTLALSLEVLTQDLDLNRKRTGAGARGIHN
jgi:hypothetical protein